MKSKGFTLLELLIVVVILGIISLIAMAVLLNALNRSKDAAVKANVSAATSTLTSAMALSEILAQTAIDNNLEVLNNPDGIDGNGDEIHSPYDSRIEAFINDETADKGQVTLIAISNNEISISGYGLYGSDREPLIVKTIKSSNVEDAEESP